MFLFEFSRVFVEHLKESGYNSEMELYSKDLEKYYIHINFILDCFLRLEKETVHVELSFYAGASPVESAKLVSRIHETFGPRIKVSVAPVFSYNPKDEGASLLKGQEALDDYNKNIRELIIGEFLKQEERLNTLLNTRGGSC